VTDRRPHTNVDALLHELVDDALHAAARRPVTPVAELRFRAWEARQRHERKRRVVTAAVAATLVLIGIAGPTVARRGVDEPTAGLGHPGGTVPGTTAGSSPGVPGSVPGSVVPPAEPPPVLDVDPGVPVAPEAPLQVARDGLGLVRFGQDQASAMAALTAALGSPDEPGTPASPGGCLPVSQRVRWGDLHVWFLEAGSGMVFSGYNWGSWPLPLNVPPAPAGPGSPTIGNAWGYQLGTPVASVEAAAARIRTTFSNARGDVPQGSVGLYARADLGDGRWLLVGLGQRADGGGLAVERIWVLDNRMINCK
jgi:hypothetical protein